MTTSQNSFHPKAAEEAGSRSYKITNTPIIPGREGNEKNPTNVSKAIPEEEEEDDENTEDEEENDKVPHLSSLPEIPSGELNLDLEFMLPTTTEVQEKVYKRASNVMKLTQENEKLQAQLKAMADQLEAMERLRAQLVSKEQNIVEKPSS